MDTSNNALVRDHVNQSSIYSSQVRLTCPICGPNRKKFNERTLSVQLDEDSVAYYCHHCLENGRFSTEEEDILYEEVSVPEMKHRNFDGKLEELSLNEEQLLWLESRGISRDGAAKFGTISKTVFLKNRDEFVQCIGFKYKNQDGSDAVKCRDSQKNFWQSGPCDTLWKIEEFKGGDLVICEGEMDTLSFGEVGILAHSVPNGAMEKPSKNKGGHDKKFSYLWAAKDKIDAASRVIIAVDTDGPGGVLGNEIARRIGRAKCWKVKFPEDCKDANDVLMKHGKDALSKCYHEATPWPVGGLRDASEYRETAIDLYRSGMQRGAQLKIAGLSEIYTPNPQTLVVCTGIPSSGKSTFVTWISYLLASDHDWPCAVFSPETSSQIHLLNIAALHMGRPFHGPDRMSEGDLKMAIDWATNRFVFLDESDCSIESVIERAEAAVLRNGVRFLVIDPYNWLTSDETESDNQHLSINKMLVALKSFATSHDIAVWLVAHPTKMYRGADGSTPIPTGYDISGSASFFNVADNGITVVRSNEPGIAEIVSWKSRYPWLGKVGRSKLRFNSKNGSFDSFREWGTRAEDWEL